MADVDTPIDPSEQVSHEVDGRVLTGVGVSADDLAVTMERHTEPPADPAAPPAPARDDTGKFAKSRGQRRFDDLTREREDARREAAETKARAEAAERERDELKARLSAPREPERPVSTPAPAPTPVATPTPAATRTKPTEDEIGSKYQSYGDYVEDLADWKAEQRLAALDFDARIRQSIEADRASRSFQESVHATFAEARKAYPDFDAVIKTGPGASVDFGARRDLLVNRPNASHLLYAIAKDGDLAHRLAALSDVEFGIAIATLAPSPAVASPASTPQGGSPVVPAPYTPVGSGSKTTAVSSSELTKRAGFDYDRSGYREQRARERGLRK